MSFTKVVAITGCDTGLGWALAARSAREGLVTVAGMYQGTETKAAVALKKLCAHPCELDVTKQESVEGFRKFVQNVLESNPNYKLHAVVNNAGVMTIGDYEWQTSSIIENTININLIGAMRVASAFLPELRRNALNGIGKPRLINIASHCGLQPLPGFAPYSASKAGVLAWTKALRLEQRTHGLAAVAFLPGGFVTSSNLLCYQENYGKTMLDNLNEEQKRIYERRLVALTNYLRAASNQNTSYDSLKDENITESFVKALLDDNPKSLYKVESWRYKFYYNLMRMPLPESVHHWIVKKFIAFPE
ncbi:hypothetical protein O0L34_g5007 [Tuta absoluta]|nr:hypothetical protein O0L34_g5007 [Tuta absoluta]